MATRLNKETREQILKSIIDATFKKRIEAAQAAKAPLALRVYNECMPPDFLEVAKTAQKGWFPTQVKFSPFFGNDNGKTKFFDFSFEGIEENYLQLHDPKPVTFRMNAASWNALNIEVTDKSLITDLLALETAISTIRKETEKLTQQIKGLLLSVATVEKFKAIAPELADYVPAEICNAGSSTALTVNVGGIVQQLMAAGLKVPK